MAPARRTPAAGSVPRPGAIRDTEAAIPAATIIVSGMPADAELRVDGNVRSGRRLKVKPGRHVLTVASGGRIARTDTLRLDGNETRTWSPRLPSAAATRDAGRATPTGTSATGRNPESRAKSARVSACDQQVASQAWPDAVSTCNAEAASGSASAKRQLGLLYQQGKGAGRNDDVAAQWLSGAAAGGDVEGMYVYANCLERGRGVKKDQPSALRWYIRAGEAGHAGAQYAAGEAFERGRLGAKKDKAQALHWYALASAQGFRDASDKVRNLSR